MMSKRRVIIDSYVQMQLDALERYLEYELKLSRLGARRRMNRIESFLDALNSPATHALCRFRRWRELGWRCAVFEKDWVFAYETFDEGIIIRDLQHTTGLKE